MNVRVAAWVAWSLAAISVAMFVAGGVLYVLARSAQSPGDWVTVGTVSEMLTFVPYLAFPIVGALVASRRPENPIGWICLASGLLLMLLQISDQYSVYGVARPGSVPYPVAIGTLSNQCLWVPTVGLLGIYLILLFPDGKLPSKRWRPLAWLSGAMIVLLSITQGLASGPLENHGGVRNPFGLEALPWPVDVANIVLLLLPICILASAVSMMLRYRRSRGEVRQQIKWLTFVASFAGLLYFIVMISGLLVFVLGNGDSLPTPPLWFELLLSLAALGFAGVPIAIGFAVLKYRLYDIDVVINLTLVYGSLTAMLVTVYFGGVAITQVILRSLWPGGATSTGRGHLDPRDSGAVQPAQAPDPVLYRLSFLQTQVRREKDPGSLLRQASRRDGPRDAEQRPCGRDKGDDAACPRLALVAPR
jgi:hypothetical protein